MKTKIKILPDPKTEAQHQANVVNWSILHTHEHPELALLFHIPNGGTRDAIEGRHLKQQGVKRGVPDLCLPVARGGYHSLYIELKTATGRAMVGRETQLPGEYVASLPRLGGGGSHAGVVSGPSR